MKEFCEQQMENARLFWVEQLLEVPFPCRELRLQGQDLSQPRFPDLSGHHPWISISAYLRQTIHRGLLRCLPRKEPLVSSLWWVRYGHLFGLSSNQTLKSLEWS